MPPLVQPPMARLQLVDEKGNPSQYGQRFLQGVANALNGTSGVVAPGVNQVTLGTGIGHFSGSGNPNGVVAGNLGDNYINTSGGVGSTLWIKEGGAPGSTTGWNPK